MSDVKSILESVLHDEKLLNSKSFRSKVYSDEPIIKRASQIKTHETPQKIKDMKALAYTPEAYWKTSAWLFYTQGSFMADYTDVYDYTDDFVRYYPTYRDFSNEQLRGYFSWRTRIREGFAPPAPVPFIYMYAFELINNIGVKSKESGFESLRQLQKNYGGNDRDLNRLLSRWMVDYAVYYSLNPSLINDCTEIMLDNYLIMLMHCDECSDSELFDAVVKLSAYPIESSRFFAKYSEDFKTVSVRVFRRLSDFFLSHRKNTLCEKYFGHITEMTYRMFESAVFLDRKSSRDTDFEINEIHRYSCRNGIWRCKKLYGNRGKNSSLGELMKGIDSLMREKYGFPYKLKPTELPKNSVTLIKTEIEAFDEEKQRKKAARIEIDLSILSGIRAAADITRDKLLTEEDISEQNDNINYDTEQDTDTVYQSDDEQIPCNNDLLSTEEALFLTALINGGDWSAAARESGSMPSVLADSINEKLYDIFGDTVIDFSADYPELIEDYTDDLKQLIGTEKSNE
ncbi:MAG: TerB N-terminal domain-containing protein [Ruminococcus sp.]